MFFQGGKVAFLATGDEAFGDGLQLLPAGANGFGFPGINLVVGSGGGNHSEQIRKFLHDLVGGRDEVFGMGMDMGGVSDEESARALANPFDDAHVLAAAIERFDAVERIGCAAAGGRFGRLGPFVDQGEGKAQLTG